MNLKDYFEKTTGTGVLATADAEGRVDAAIYARPHMLEDGTFAFIMLDRLTHKNLQSNPYATFLFMEKGEGYKGVRLFLKKAQGGYRSRAYRKSVAALCESESDSRAEISCHLSP